MREGRPIVATAGRVARRLVIALAALAVAAPVASVVAVPIADRSSPGIAVATDVVGPISADTAWTKAGSPYRISGQLIVEPGATLTIEPGVEVRLAPQAQFLVRGALDAVGTAQAPISLLGEDETPGSWPGMQVLGGAEGARATIRHAVLAHGGGSGGYGAQLYAYFAAIDLSDVEVRDGAGIGVAVESASLRMRHVSLSRNAGDAVFVTGLQTSDPAYAPDLDNLAMDGNGSNVVALRGPGGFSRDFTFRDLGVPFEIRGQITATATMTLFIQPGAEIQFAEDSELVTNGAIQAIGTTESPITLRGVKATPGSWDGIRVIGASGGSANAHFEHVTVTDAGPEGHAAITVTDGRLVFIDGAVSAAVGDGIRVDGGVTGGTTRIEGSSFTGIGASGVVNDTTGLVLAPNNWWGSPRGPSTGNSCGQGTGTRVTGLVRTAPWLTAADARADPLKPAPVPVITLAPRRWYAPADGQTQVWVDLTLRDPFGHPMGGRVINLFSTLGNVTTGGVTDAGGHTLAAITSTQTGNAELSAVLDGADPCEQADAGEAIVTFTDAENALVDGEQAPYMAEGMEITPEPVIVGADTTLRARISNPNAASIRVVAEFALADFGIGLTFGPVGAPIVKEIPANGSAVFETTWQAPISGHYCLEVRYRILAPGETGAESAPFAALGLPPSSGRVDVFAGPGGGKSGKNLNAFGGPAGGWNPPPQPSLKGSGGGKPRDTGAGAGSGAEQTVSFLGWLGFTSSGEINKNMQGDPPRADYTLVAEPVRRTIDHGAKPAAWSDGRFAADNALIDALAEYVALGDAAIVSLDRYGGATAAQDLHWASVQASSIIYYRRQLGLQATVIADRIAALRAIVERESPEEETTIEEARARLQVLRDKGFTASEIAAAHAFGIDDARLAAILADQLQRTPEMLASRAVDDLATAEGVYRRLATTWTSIRTFPEEDAGTAAASSADPALTSDLAAVGEGSATFELANPLDVETKIELRSRPISLPAGWAVTMSPSEVSLKPGEKTTIEVTISPSGPVPQGTVARVAVEGYASDALLGGVVLAMMIPEYVPFSGGGSAASGGLPVLLVVAVALAAAGALLVWFVFRRRRSQSTP